MNTTVSKLDLRKVDTNYYKASQTPEVKDLDPYYYLTIEGQSAPEDPLFLGAIETIYAVAYAVKFLCKAEDNDFTVPKMEAFWWLKGGVESMEQFEQAPREEWCWKIVIRMPDFVESNHYFRAIESVKVKKPELVHIEKVKYELINEGKCVQILHVGSYENERTTLDKLHRYVDEEGMKIAGNHHEIYLTDPRKTAAEKLKTIIRYAVD